MAKRKFTWRDIQYHAVNDQDTVRGTNVTVEESNMFLFITSIDGASNSNPATIKDAAGTTITLVTSDKEYFVPLRMDAGFNVTASGAVTVKFFRAIGSPD